MDINNILVSLGEKIKTIRVQKKIKQHILADDINISQTTLSRIENGTGYISLQELYSIAKVLEVPINELLGIDKLLEENVLLQNKIRNLNSSDTKNITGGINYTFTLGLSQLSTLS